MSGVTVQVVPFGPLTDQLVAPGEMELELPLPVAEIRAVVTDRWPQLKGRAFRLAVDKQLLEEAAVVTEAQELALLPPFAGG